MALIHCPECGKQISDKATTCPHCGISLQIELLRIREEQKQINHNIKTTSWFSIWCEDQKKKRRRNILIVAVVALVVGVLAFIYVPKIKANVKKERAERLAHDFSREVEKMQAALPQLCEKYAMQSLDEPIAVDWSKDSLKLVEALMPYLTMDEYKAKAMQALQTQGEGIVNSRLDDFDRLLLTEFKTTNDAIVVKIREGLPGATDSELLIEARKWYDTRQ